MEPIKLTQQEILEKVFKPKRMGAGYDPQDVDTFLDDVIKDYGAYDKRIEHLEDQVKRLQETLQVAHKKVLDAEQKAKTAEQKLAELAKNNNAQSKNEKAEVANNQAPQATAAPQAGNANLDLLQRVALLEKLVFELKTEEMRKNSERKD